MPYIVPITKGGIGSDNLGDLPQILNETYNYAIPLTTDEIDTLLGAEEGTYTIQQSSNVTSANITTIDDGVILVATIPSSDAFGQSILVGDWKLLFSQFMTKKREDSSVAPLIDIAPDIRLVFYAIRDKVKVGFNVVGMTQDTVKARFDEINSKYDIYLRYIIEEVY